MTAPAQIHLTLPDGSSREVPQGTTPLAVATAIGPRLAAAAVGAELDGETVDLRTPLTRGGALRIVTAGTPEAGPFVRHSAEHLLADAVRRLWPEAEYDAGRQDHSEKYQYDFRFPRPFTPEDLERIEAEMRRIIAEDAPFERIEVSREEAARIFREMGFTLKLERLADIPEGETITLYRHGAFTDLCRGPHVQRAGQVGAIKLLEASGSYFKGDERNERLQRIYGTAFSSERELAAYLEALAEARARDHRKLGPELDLFSFDPLAPASPFFHPKGAVVYNLLIDYVRELNTRNGYGEVVTPQILDVELWHTSGHWANYRENMFFTELDERQYAVKPMNCPTHCLIYAKGLRSYRDLPIRYADFGRLHRYERSGVTSGLTRVRSFAQDDAHVFCTDEQVEAEVLRAVGIIFEIYRTFEFPEVAIGIGLRPENRVGTDAQWDAAERALQRALDRQGLAYTLNPGDGAFYGPKIDFRIKDAIGREWQLGTVQLDYQMPERFGLEYVGADGATHRPVMIHRAMLGSVERFLGILIEHTAGAFPLWLAPVQAVVLPVSERFLDYGQRVRDELAAAGLRVEIDDGNEKLGYKIRQAQLRKVPYMLVVGEREAAAGTAAVRLRSGEDRGPVAVPELIAKLREAAAARRVAEL
ncbi:MAG: threonine--tRNA ligase [Acidobacteria bacterium]|jgi:threonyl-tRNA synthetase|nr:threonine--tRNA ligase [Thermoanaerobaculia bacterium]MDI9630268.1 threonine--tRNA ligase [Acidobacteriota bacterium]MBP7812224.1 threonine--tRNA ligase [Thermoanaerobaculia bacterium]NLN12277.1 threonine--tRNA ligase [Acidobacteriota bacterium]HNZ96203.1 threonine--tRNA ligase [Thermoanaerobaculia bacterium]